MQPTRAAAAGQAAPAPAPCAGRRVQPEALRCAGSCFLLGGFKYKEQTFNAVANKASASLLFLAAIALVVPSYGRLLYGVVEISDSEILNVSYTTAIILILVYAPPGPGSGQLHSCAPGTLQVLVYVCQRMQPACAAACS